MFSKLIFALAALISMATVLQADNSTAMLEFITEPTLISKKHCKKEHRGPRGHRGHRGYTGQNGSTGTNGVNGSNGQTVQASPVYADALLELPAGGSSFSFSTPIPLNQITRASGVDTTVPGSFIIQSAGDYFITYYICGQPDSTSAAGISLLLNGVSVPGSTVGIAVIDSTRSILGGETILNLSVGDTIQMAEEGNISSTRPSPTAPVKVASLTIEKVSL